MARRSARRHRSDRPRWAGVDRILRREPYPPRRRHIVHPGDPRDPERCGSLEGHRGQSGRGQLLPSRGGARRRPEPLRDRDPDRDGVGPGHGIRVAGGRGIHDDRRGGGGGHGQGIQRVRGDPRGQDGGRRNRRRRWPDPSDPPATARERLAHVQPMRRSRHRRVRRGRRKRVRGTTEPPKESGQGEQGSVPPTSTSGAGGEGGTTGGATGGATGGTPPPPPPNQRPRAGFLVTPRLGPAPLRVGFTDASHDPDGDPLSRHWSFGDGAAQSGGKTPSHTYHDPAATP